MSAWKIIFSYIWDWIKVLIVVGLFAIQIVPNLPYGEYKEKNTDISERTHQIFGDGSPDEYNGIIYMPDGSFLVDINHANGAALRKLPGIGPTKAQDIILYREENGLFSCIEELLNVKGIGESTLDQIKNMIIISKAVTITRNSFFIIDLI